MDRSIFEVVRLGITILTLIGVIVTGFAAIRTQSEVSNMKADIVDLKVTVGILKDRSDRSMPASSDVADPSS